MAAIRRSHVGQTIANKFAPTANRRRLGGDEESPFGGKAGAHETHQIHEKMPDRSAVGAQGKRNVWRCVVSRIGKIARLPKAIREELNRRLEDGEQQNHLVEWLNGHAEVHPPSPGLRRAGAAECDRQPDWARNPINESNLTAWKQGGYVDWLRQQEALDVGQRMIEETSELDAMARQEPGDGGRRAEDRGQEMAGRSLADRVAMMAALAIGEQLMAARRMEDGAEKRRTILKLVRGLVRLRKSDREQERAMREAAQHERSGEMHEAWAERGGRRTVEGEAVVGKTVAGETVDRRRWSVPDGRRPRSIEEMSDAQIQATLERLGRERRTVDSETVDGETVDDEAVDGETVAVGTVTFEIRGGEAHGHLAEGEQARAPAAAGPMAGKHGKAGDHETHELHENKSPDRDSGAEGSIRHCRIQGI